MTRDRFQLQMEKHGNIDEYCIIDTSKKPLEIYNGLGDIYFSSAPQLCELLNQLDKSV